MPSSWRYRLTPKRRNGQLETWCVDLTTPAGQRSRVSLGTADEDEARERMERWAREALPKIKEQYNAIRQDQSHTPDKDPQLSRLIDYYIDTYLVTRNVRPRSIERIVPVIRDFGLYCRSRHVGRASQLSRRIVDDWAADLARRKQAPKTIHTSLGFVRAMLNACLEADLLDFSPVQTWLMPILDEPEKHPLDAEAVRLRLAAVLKHEPKHYPPIAWIAHTGNRVGGTRNLNWKHIDLETRSIVRPQKPRRLARYEFSQEACDILLSVKDKAGPDGTVFIDPTSGTPYPKNKLMRVWARCQEAEGLQVATLKDLRDSFASIMANIVRIPLPQLQVLMGHASIEMTMKYVRAGSSQPFLDDYLKLLKTLAPSGTTPKNTRKRGSQG